MRLTATSDQWSGLTGWDRRRAKSRAEILAAARAAFAERGYDGVSMRQLAEDVGLSHGALYQHFETKEQLFDALVEESFDSLAAALRRLPRSGDPVRLIRRAARLYVSFGVENPSAYEFAFILKKSGEPPRAIKPHLAYELLRALVKRAIDEKRFRRMRVDTASQALWAAVHGITALLVTRPRFPWAGREAVIRNVIDSAVDGLLRTSER